MLFLLISYRLGGRPKWTARPTGIPINEKPPAIFPQAALKITSNSPQS